MPVISVPDLKTNFAASDDDFIPDWNTNFTNILTSFVAFKAAIDQAFEATGVQLLNDWVRRRDVADQDGGRFGADSFVISVNDPAGEVTLSPQNFDNVSVAYFDGVRYEQEGSIIGRWSDVLSSDGTFTVYVGIKRASETASDGVVIDLDESISAIAGVALYSVEVTKSGGTYTTEKIRQVDRTLLWDNTLEQANQEREISFQRFEPATLQSDYDFIVPFEHKFVRAFYTPNGNGGSADDRTYQIVAKGASPVAAVVVPAFQLLGHGTTPAHTLGEVAVSASWIDVAFPKDTIYHMSQIANVDSPTDFTFGISVLPTFGVPTAS